MGMSLTTEDKQWIRELMSEQVAQLQEQLVERMDSVETRLLTEFHKWASPT